jgi:hypothetical protein
VSQLPTGSAAFQARNLHLFLRGDIGRQPDSSPLLDGRSVERELPHCDEFEARDCKFRLVITGQIRGGKNNIIITRTGKRIAKPAWRLWCDDAIEQVRSQLRIAPFTTITEPVNIRINYFSGDRCKRDQPAIIDAIFHVLEKSGVVADDSLLWVTHSQRSYDKANPRAIIEFL